LHKDAEPPFRLGKRQWIDFTDNHKAGMAKLLLAIQRLDKPEGQLDILKDRLADAERDLVRATQEDKPRIQSEIEELIKQIEVQQKIAEDPKAAAEQTQKNIEAGLERERQPVKPTAAQTSTKFINPPPGIAPNYFQDRFVETEQIVHFLQDDSQRLMTIVGRGGVGKTAMVCRLLKGLEGGELPDGLGNMRVEGIVYLSESGSHRVNFANLFYDLCKLLPADAANALDTVYKNPQASTASKMSALLDRFTAGKVVLLLDNVEPLISVETFDIADAELDECLRALLHGAHSALKVILTTRVAPRGLNLCEPGRQRVLTLDSGLEQKYAVEMLREMDVDGKLGLKSANLEALKRAYERTLGFPRALEALFAILASDRYTTLEELLAMPTPVNVVEALVGEAFNRLDTNAQKVMQALAVYNRPVPAAAVDYLLAPHIPAIDSAPILQRLANMHFARKESGRFYLHPVDREFAFSLIPNPSPAGRGESSRFAARQGEGEYTQHDLLSRAADYFRQARKPRAEWKKLDDLATQLAEFDLRCAAGDYDKACRVLTDIDFDYLYLWGCYRLLIQLRLRIKDGIRTKNLIMENLNSLGLSYRSIGYPKEAILYYELGLTIAKETNDKKMESVFLANLGLAYASIDKIHKAIALYEKALAINREIGNRHGECNALANLGNRFLELGDSNKAIEFNEQALVIAREVGNRRFEGNALNGLGRAYKSLNLSLQCIQYHQQALMIRREIKDRQGEGITLGDLGRVYSMLGDTTKATQFHNEAFDVFHEIGIRDGETIELINIGVALLSDGKYRESVQHFLQSVQIADEIHNLDIQFYARLNLAQAYLFQKDLINARTTIEAALQYDVPENN
ncbi:MAG: hypothetical protein EDM79_18305, partial [Chloroflexi bacterium]